MIKSFAAFAILAVLGASVIALPSFAPKAEASERVALAKADRLAVRAPPQNCSKQIWPDFATPCFAYQRFGRKGCRSAPRDGPSLVRHTPSEQQSGIMMLDVQINRIHSGAICNEIGERLSAAALNPQSNELPARLQALIDELAKAEARELPTKLQRD